MSGWGALHVLPSTAGQTFSDDCWVRYSFIYDYCRISLGAIFITITRFLFKTNHWVISLGSIFSFSQKTTFNIVIMFRMMTAVMNCNYDQWTVLSSMRMEKGTENFTVLWKMLTFIFSNTETIDFFISYLNNRYEDSILVDYIIQVIKHPSRLIIYKETLIENLNVLT